MCMHLMHLKNYLNVKLATQYRILIIEDGVYQKNLFEHLKQKIKCKEYEKIETAGIFTCGFL